MQCGLSSVHFFDFLPYFYFFREYQYSRNQNSQVCKFFTAGHGCFVHYSISKKSFVEGITNGTLKCRLFSQPLSIFRNLFHGKLFERYFGWDVCLYIFVGLPLPLFGFDVPAGNFRTCGATVGSYFGIYVFSLLHFLRLGFWQFTVLHRIKLWPYLLRRFL